METGQTKKLKIKIAKTGTKQSKAIVPQYKAKCKFVCGKKTCVLKGSIMNSRTTNRATENASLKADTSSKKQTVAEYLQQCKKKPFASAKKTGNSKQNSVGLFLESRQESENTSLAGKDDGERSSAICEQRNIGAPVIIEALSDTLSSFIVPEIFRNNSAMWMGGNDVSELDPQQVENVDLMRNEVIVTQPLNDNNNTNDEGNHNRVVSPAKVIRRCRKNIKHVQKVNTNNLTLSEELGLSSSRVSDVRCDDRLDKEGDKLELEIDEMKNSSDVREDEHLVRFYSLKNKVVAVMSEKGKFCFTGKLVVKVLHGAVESYGCVLTAKNGLIEIYSPRGYSNVSIETSKKYSTDGVSDIWPLLSAEGIDQETENKLVMDLNRVQGTMAVILLWNFENKLTKFLNVFYPFRLFPKIKSGSCHSWTDYKRAEAILQSNLYIGNGCKELVVDSRVTQEVGQKMLNDWKANKWSCTLVAGGKSVGKSTTTRYLINSILPVTKRVILVDFDPGQAECTPHSCISFILIEEPLMGPNFTHLKTPLFQLYIGDVNVTRCITRYIKGMRLLIDKLLSYPDLSRSPIVVNTMGFAQGIGWDIMMYTIKLLRPSVVLQIMSEKPKNNFIGYLSKQVVNRQQPSAFWGTNVIDWNRPCEHELYVIRSQAERKTTPGYEIWNIEPYQQRELVMISYLSEIVRTHSNSVPHCDDLSLSINEAVPYATSFSSLSISIPRAYVPPTHVLNVINGNIVALCGIDVQEDESMRDETVSGPRILNRPPLCTCYGFGIVRGVDMERKEVFINTPLPVEAMQYVNCLMGCISVPVTLLLLNQQKNVPYTGGNHVIPMSREHRRGYFRMRYHKAQNNP